MWISYYYCYYYYFVFVCPRSQVTEFVIFIFCFIFFFFFLYVFTMDWKGTRCFALFNTPEPAILNFEFWTALQHPCQEIMQISTITKNAGHFVEMINFNKMPIYRNNEIKHQTLRLPHIHSELLFECMLNGHWFFFFVYNIFYIFQILNSSILFMSLFCLRV